MDDTAAGYARHFVSGFNDFFDIHRRQLCNKSRMPRCASSNASAAYTKVRLTPHDSHALPAAFLQSCLSM